MRITLIQKDIGDTDYRAWLDRATADDPDLVAFSELATTGCLYRSQPVPSLEDVTASLGQYRFDILLGVPYRSAAGIFNAYLFYQAGQVQIYNKINLFRPFDEHLIYTAGQQLGLFETYHDRLGVAICYDLRFDDIFARLKIAGATKVFVPAAFPLVRIADWEQLLTQRAGDHGFCVLGINAVGRDARNEFGGRSMAVSAGGEIIDALDSKETGLLTVEI